MKMQRANKSDEKKWCHTKIEKKIGYLSWKIGGFSLCSLPNGKCLSSTAFQISGESQMWVLELYPRGKNEESEEFISVCVANSDNEDENNESDNESESDASVTCSISVINSSGAKVHTTEFECDGDDGHDKYIPRKELLSSKDLLPNDELTLVAYLTTTTTSVKRTGGGSDSVRNRLQSVANSYIMPHNLCNDLQNLRRSGTHADVMLKTGDLQVPAHKALLAARSPIFAAMFKHEMVESATNTVTISDVEGDVMEQLLSFVYTDTCSIYDLDFALKLLSAADKYDIPTLKQHCATYIIPNMTSLTVFQVLVTADACGVARLRRFCIDLICRDLTYLVTVTPNWKSQLESCPRLLCEILEKLTADSMNPDTDEMAFMK